MKRALIWIWFVVMVLSYHSLQAETYKFKGKHYLASYYDCDESAIHNIERLKEAFLQAVKASGAHLLDSSYYEFPGDGLTMIALLSESHASIHTYPEYNACFVDLFTCGDLCSYEAFEKNLEGYLKPKELKAKHFCRS